MEGVWGRASPFAADLYVGARPSAGLQVGKRGRYGRLCEPGLGRPGLLLGGRRPRSGRAGLAVPIQSEATIEEQRMAATYLATTPARGARAQLLQVPYSKHSIL